MTRIATLITCHNRREKTLSCVAQLSEQLLPAGTRVDVYLLDDGSTDGTTRAVRACFPHVNIIEGNGTYYWADGMREAWRCASEDDPDAYLWLNDDTLLDREAIAALLRVADVHGGQPVVVVGS